MCVSNISLKLFAFASLAEDISGEGTSIYPVLPRSPTIGGHAAAVPDEPQGHQVKQHHTLECLCLNLNTKNEWKNNNSQEIESSKDLCKIVTFK